MIIVEGPDNSGKSTLIQALASQLKLPMARTYRMPQTEEDIQRWHNWANAAPHPLILDRHPAISDLIYSPLQQKYTADGKTVEVFIYRLPDSGWTLEIVDQYDNSTVYDGEFATDQEAFDLFLEEVESEGIAAMIGPAPGQ